MARRSRPALPLRRLSKPATQSSSTKGSSESTQGPMDVSVVVPTRNRSALLSRTLRSALRQERVDFEVIVVDDASDDETPALLSALDDHRVRVLRHETLRGLSSSRNHGAEHARAEWLAFLDDDDLWAPDKLFRQVSAAKERG